MGCVGIIPMVELDGLGYFNIGDTLLTFAVSSRTDCGADVRAFVGRADTLLEMLQDVLNAPSLLFMSSDDMIDLVQQYISKQSRSHTPQTAVLGIDTDKRLFDFSRNDALDIVGPYLRLREGSIDPTLLVRAPAPAKRTYYDMSDFQHLSTHPVAYAEVNAFVERRQ